MWRHCNRNCPTWKSGREQDWINEKSISELRDNFKEPNMNNSYITKGQEKLRNRNNTWSRNNQKMSKSNERNSFSTNRAGKIGYPDAKPETGNPNQFFDPYLIPCTKIQRKWIIEQDASIQLKVKIFINLCCTNIFFTQKKSMIHLKKDKLDFIKIKNICLHIILLREWRQAFSLGKSLCKS